MSSCRRQALQLVNIQSSGDISWTEPAHMHIYIPPTNICTTLGLSHAPLHFAVHHSAVEMQQWTVSQTTSSYQDGTKELEDWSALWSDLTRVSYYQVHTVQGQGMQGNSNAGKNDVELPLCIRSSASEESTSLRLECDQNPLHACLEMPWSGSLLYTIQLQIF
jgi:hypothetical protein